MERERLDSKGRVHFIESQLTPDHAGHIHLELTPDGTHADAHLGFLQKNRKYGLTLTIPKYLGEHVAISEVNPNVSLLASRPAADKTRHTLGLELVAHKDGLQNEELQLSIESSDHPFTITLSARVLGVGKGTPSLKTGIHLLGAEHADDDSVLSDAANGAQP